MSRGRILLICPEAVNGDKLHAMLKTLPAQIDLVREVQAAAGLLGQRRFHAIILILAAVGRKPAEDEFICLVKGSDVPVIVLAEQGDVGLAERFHAAGVFDFMIMPVDRQSFLGLVRRALLRSGLWCPADGSSAPDPPMKRFPFLVGTSEPMLDVLRRISKAAEADANVCVFGETGTGKELIARAIHYSSRRADRPMMVFDCTAVPDGLMESEMFGHVKGSFTSAVADRDGMFQLANGGSLLFDEIGELGLPLQAKLLRVIQTREFRKVGGKEPIKVDLRIIAATNRNLAEMANAGTFREDLFFRLDVLSIRVPPLRQRKEDIPLLVQHFIEKFNRNNQKQIHGVHPKTMAALLRHHWPGNVRELENCIERAAVMSDQPMLTIEQPGRVVSSMHSLAQGAAGVDDTSWPLNLKEAEKLLMLRALRSVGGDKNRAAELLGVSLRTLYYKLKDIDGAKISNAKRLSAEPAEALPLPNVR